MIDQLVDFLKDEWTIPSIITVTAVGAAIALLMRSTPEALRERLSELTYIIEHMYSGRTLAIFSQFLAYFENARSQSSQISPSEPPKLAEFLLGVFLKGKNRRGILACINEQFENDLANGVSFRRAKRRYWAETLRSIGPLAWKALKRVGFIAFFLKLLSLKIGA